MALPTRIKFDMLPSNALPKSNTASFTQNWARDVPDDNFLHEVVNRWRQQTFNPGSADYSVEMGPNAPAASEAPPQPAVRRPPPYAPQQPAALRPTLPAADFGEAAPHRTAQPAGIPMPGQFPAPPLQPQPQSAQQAKESLASLLKQFRS